MFTKHIHHDAKAHSSNFQRYTFITRFALIHLFWLYTFIKVRIHPILIAKVRTYGHCSKLWIVWKTWLLHQNEGKETKGCVVYSKTFKNTTDTISATLGNVFIFRLPNSDPAPRSTHWDPGRDASRDLTPWHPLPVPKVLSGTFKWTHCPFQEY